MLRRYHTAQFTNVSDLVKFFHELLGHPSIDTMLSLVASSAIANFPSELTPSAVRKYYPHDCPACPAGQLARRPTAPTDPSLSLLSGEEFEVDFKGPWTDADGKQVLSLSRNKFSFTAVDTNADFAYACFAPNRSQVVKHLEKLRLFALKKTGNRLKIIRSDDEFFTDAVKDWAAQEHVKVTLLPAIPHEHDRVKRIERLHRTLQDIVNKQLAFQSHLSPAYWELAYRHALDLHNIRPRVSLSGKSPYEIYYGFPYDLAKYPIFPFGSIIMGHIPLSTQTSLSGRSDEMYFVGIAHDFNCGIRLYNPVTKSTVTRHSFKFISIKEPVVPTFVISDHHSPLLLSSSDSLPGSSSPMEEGPKEEGPKEEGPKEEGPTDDLLQEDGSSISDVSSISSSPSISLSASMNNYVQSLASPDSSPTWSHIPLPYHAAPKSSKRYYNYIGRTFQDKSNGSSYEIVDIVTSSAPDNAAVITFKFFDTSTFSVPPSLDDLFEYEEIDQFLADKNYVFTSPVQSYLRRKAHQLKVQKEKGIPSIPLSIDQALRHQYSAGFMAALDDEIDSLRTMETFRHFFGDVKSIPKGRLINSKVVFDMVYNPDGSFKKFKARLVARGDQLNQVDPNNFAGTVKSETMRFLLAVVAEKDLDYLSLDVKTAFLYPPLHPDDKVWMKRPKGITDSQMPPVVELHKAIYGLPKASQYFEEFLSAQLIKLGFVRTVSDKQLFVLRRDGNICYLSTHVDDLFVACTPSSGLHTWVQTQLEKVFTLTSRPESNIHLGLVITRDRPRRSLTISQPAYIQSTLDRFRVTSDHSKVDSPMSDRYLPDMSTFISDPVLPPDHITLYQEVVGCLQYLADQTRPDLKYPVNQLSRRSKAPTRRDFRAARRVLFYLEQTKLEGLTFCTHGFPFEMYVTADASYNCYADSKSHTGISIHLGRFSGSVSSLSLKQSVIADSSTVAEFIGSHKACQQIAWAQNLLHEMDIVLSQPATLYQDNMSTIKILHHKGNEARTKHIALRYNIIREFIQQGLIVIKYLSTDLMTADTLTKALSGPLFNFHKTRLLNLQPPSASDIASL